MTMAQNATEQTGQGLTIKQTAALCEFLRNSGLDDDERTEVAHILAMREWDEYWESLQKWPSGKGTPTDDAYAKYQNAWKHWYDLLEFREGVIPGRELVAF